MSLRGFAQLSLAFPNSWGGRRRGAGRKPRQAGRRFTPHRARPAHNGAHPVHVTMRAGFRPLRSQYVFPTLRRVIAETRRRRGDSFRVVHFTVQQDHLHLIVEATDKTALSAGARGLAIAIARHVNRLVFRKGKFWADRWHGRELTTPRAVRHALVYVLANGQKHGSSRTCVDAFSSAPYFDGYAELRGRALIALKPEVVPRSLHPPGPPPVSLPQRWLLRQGWRRHGMISVVEVPRPR